jgi:transcription elongation GreA/GreB family factor
MTELAMRRPSIPQRWPMTREAWLTLGEELGRLRADVTVLAGELAHGVADLAVVRAARRLDVLSAVFAAAEQIHEPERVVIGRQFTLLEAEGEPVSYTLVYPGDGDPARGWISADSPLGSAVLGCGPGDRASVSAPAGQRVVSVLSVD